MMKARPDLRSSTDSYGSQRAPRMIRRRRSWFTMRGMAFRKRRPAFTRWGGWEAGLSVLRTSDPTRLDPLDRSGLRHLAAHLESGGHEDDLHQLFRLEWTEAEAPIDPDG